MCHGKVCILFCMHSVQYTLEDYANKIGIQIVMLKFVFFFCMHSVQWQSHYLKLITFLDPVN